jgi:cytochrome b6-f complex iron-sulfur subunit
VPVVRRRTLLNAAAATGLAGCSSQSADRTDGGSDDEPVAGQLVAPLDMPIGTAVRTTTLGPAIIVTRTGPDSAVAFSAVCPHTGCSVQALGASIACPCHRSVFDVSTGEVLEGPAPRGLDPFAVVVVNGNVVTA